MESYYIRLCVSGFFHLKLAFEVHLCGGTCRNFIPAHGCSVSHCRHGPRTTDYYSTREQKCTFIGGCTFTCIFYSDRLSPPAGRDESASGAISPRSLPVPSPLLSCCPCSSTPTCFGASSHLTSGSARGKVRTVINTDHENGSCSTLGSFRSTVPEDTQQCHSSRRRTNVVALRKGSCARV